MPTDRKAKPPTQDADRPSHFIREIVEADLASGKHERIVTRFPPEPNGFLHIGHAKAISVDAGIARDFGGHFHLRFDDTNPATERTDYVEAIQEDVRWLGFPWDRLCFASDYFPQLYAFAEELVCKGLAYVDSQTAEQVRETRGTPYEPGTDSPYRDRPVEENLDLLRRMKAGEFPDGAHVLRAKIDMASPNIVMRDPPLYRIKHAHHHRQGDEWCLYPMYDFAHCLEDAIEGVTHSLCTLEFEINRELYDWVIDNVSAPSRPRQIEFARLNLDYTVVSKRKLLPLVEQGLVSGWDDPRMPTLRGLRRRGVRASALRAFCDLIGVAKRDSTVDVGKLEYCIRHDLNAAAPRVLAVLRPLKVTLTTWPEGEVDELDAPYWPDDVGLPGSRTLPFGRELLIDRDDFMLDPPRSFKRLAPGGEVRLRYGYVIRCDEVVRDADGEVVELRCSHDPDSRGGATADGRRVPGTIHWVSAAHGVPCEVRLYDRLFAHPRPGAEGDFMDDLNPRSLEVCADAVVEPSVIADLFPGRGEADADAAARHPERVDVGLSTGADLGAHPVPEDVVRYQFERLGFFAADPDGTPERPVFNRIVTLKDSWAKVSGAAGGDVRAEQARERKARESRGRAAPTVKASHERDALRAADPVLAGRFRRYVDELGVSEAEADILSGEVALGDYFEQVLAEHDAPASVARWMVHELMGAARGEPLASLPFDAATFARLVALVDDGTLSASGGKTVLGVLVEEGGDPAAIVEARGLAQVQDQGALAAAVEAVLARHPEELARYAAGEARLFGFFMGAVMKETRGAGDPAALKALLTERLAASGSP